ncbi:hypothetical protein GCM10009662_20230 [Catellatospora coxensis]|uniref:Uncharacterized protein n=1 Tax=Catellatospora coxensis TaxID=310354 RepID=A0A8J3L9R5_9ACTN|nr:hypothetical protein Cco03nite_55500 [Catellatospora coxensis]
MRVDDVLAAEQAVRVLRGERHPGAETVCPPWTQRVQLSEMSARRADQHDMTCTIRFAHLGSFPVDDPQPSDTI